MINNTDENTEQSILNDFSLRDFLFIVFRHKIKIILFFILSVFVSLVYVLSIPDEYISEASLLVTPGRENITIIPSSETQKNFSVSRSPLDELLTEVEIFRNRGNFESLVDRIGLRTLLGVNKKLLNFSSNAESLQIRDYMIDHLINNVSIQNKRNSSNIIIVSYFSQNPELSNIVVSELINIYLARRSQIRYSKDPYDFYNKQVDKTKNEIDIIEGKLNEIKNNKNISSIEINRSMISGRIELIQQQKDQNNALIAESKSKIGQYKKDLSNIPERIEDDNTGDSGKNNDELTALYTKERELLSKYTEENILVINIRKQIAELKNRILNQTKKPDSANMSYQQLQEKLADELTNLSSLEAKNRDLNETLASLKKEENVLNNDELEINRLERERTILIDNYNKYRSGLEETQIDQIVKQQNISNIKVLQPATYPREPISSRKFRNLALGIFLGFWGGISLAIFSEYFDHSTKRTEDVTKWLKLKTLVSIPEDKVKKKYQKKVG